MAFISKHQRRCNALLWLIATVCGSTGQAQVLQLKDTFPEIILSQVRFYTNDLLRWSDFGQKPVVLYFWDSRCSSSLQTLEHIERVQQRVGRQVQLVAVTKESPAVIDQYMKQHLSRPLSFPMVIGDSLVHRRLPKEGYPYTVWLDEQRVIRYITPGYNISEKNLQRLRNGDEMKLRYSVAKRPTGSLMDAQAIPYRNALLYYSSLSACLEDFIVDESNGRITDSGAVTIRCNCRTPIELLKLAYGEQGRYPVYSTYGFELHVKHPERYIAPEDPSEAAGWKLGATYNYELVLPAVKKDSVYKVMQADLSRYFPLTAVRTTKKVKGYTLVQLEHSPVLHTKEGAPRDSYNDGRKDSSSYLEFINQPMSRLVYLLNFWMGATFPFRDHTNYKDQIDFRIHKTSVQPLNIEALRADLRRYNLDLRETTMETPVLFVSD